VDADLQNAINAVQKMHIQVTESQYHLDSAHSPTNCCINSPDPTVSTHHKKDISHSPLTWSNVACELEKAKYQQDMGREHQCLDFLRQPSVLSNLGHQRVALLADRFNVFFLKERVALQQLLSHVIRAERDGYDTCQFGARINFRFIDYLDRKPPATPTCVVNIHHSTLIRIMKWAHANDEIPTLSLIEQFLLSDDSEKYFIHHMHLHLANRFNFPTLRMQCLSSLRTVDCIEQFQSSPEYLHSLSSIDRELIEKRAEVFRRFRDAGQRIPDEIYLFDVHSGCYFKDSIEARYSVDLYHSSTSDDSDDSELGGFGGEITGISFDY
ncbi:hypothetical protein PENTCL1PPCAC_6121, partial [Pristionchus entomophagus]